MIIWGTTSRQEPVAAGQFLCPYCRRQTPYTLFEVSRYFTLYFIPLFRIGTAGRAVACHACGLQSPPDALAAVGAEVVGEAGPWSCRMCGNENPGEYDHCLRCRRWVCAACGTHNRDEANECLRCRGRRTRR